MQSFERIYSYLALFKTSWIPNSNPSNQVERVEVDLAWERVFHEGMKKSEGSD